MKNITLLTGHVSEDTAYIIQNYPWGFKLRTEQKIWIETNKNGQRVVKRTKDPRSGKWCAPKKSVYCKLQYLYRNNDTGHIESVPINFYSSSEIEKTMQEYGIPESKETLKCKILSDQLNKSYTPKDKLPALNDRLKRLITQYQSFE